MTITATAKQCKARNRAGRPCAAYAVRGSEYCFWHDPGSASARRVARSAGGLARHGRTIGPMPDGERKPVTPREVGDVLANDAARLEELLAEASAMAQTEDPLAEALSDAAWLKELLAEASDAAQTEDPLAEALSDAARLEELLAEALSEIRRD